MTTANANTNIQTVDAKDYAKTVRAILKELYPNDRFAVRVDYYNGPRAIVVTLKGGKVFPVGLRTLLWSIMGNTLTSEAQRVYRTESGLIAPDVAHVVCHDLSVKGAETLEAPVAENSKTLSGLEFVAEI